MLLCLPYLNVKLTAATQLRSSLRVRDLDSLCPKVATELSRSAVDANNVFRSVMQEVLQSSGTKLCPILFVATDTRRCKGFRSFATKISSTVGKEQSFPSSDRPHAEHLVVLHRCREAKGKSRTRADVEIRTNVSISQLEALPRKSPSSSTSHIPTGSISSAAPTPLCGSYATLRLLRHSASPPPPCIQSRSLTCQYFRFPPSLCLYVL
ncbi:uncharacterized protein RSE6_02564 [Rhynchosporium secalis]|uniref:Uncharacterized protein n=1 Tax=Rhynchosporium secalis TaxID=38038 RepID=A0A1E1M0H7_RHYSE|nr:uncharacterized protein RSE6_02564 [Rhynchosporium secalis]